ncbi:hypothetical protein SPRG_00726 [Saprolegnia parasitica CBS 223.65]|uniref:Cysteine/serine-rich nuclear protein N-terminal domain-containing protein n=1 Tax=Saprolegnia parasitica (strain CBS 223.65) TaxID=695850 RepID=A0A067CVZ3_SAPPC|nr:hypothetical protein SPRG_00726 [Saprolegnia parasitica CBS 223.65]KDO34663.1 hypothetical protein SPRG_00726 [Saprolegnia parasitica CBS 223.65]|eukprot:XP_012194337.1 hypothetical protein SPRG_00726 [Saprolegnia parasitica CBS 223.65]
MIKQVTFSTATTFLFDLDYNGSAVPHESGPPIGLAPRHCAMTIEPVPDAARCCMRRSRLRRFDHLERIAMLRSLYDARTLALFCSEAIDLRKSRVGTEDDIVRITPRPSRKRHFEPEVPVDTKRMRMWEMEYDDDDDEEGDDDEDKDESEIDDDER